MNTDAYTYTDLFNELSPESIVITPNNRLSNLLHIEFADFQKQQGHTIWPAECFIPMKTWIKSLWDELVQTSSEPLPTLLHPHQSHALWQSVLKTDNPSSFLCEEDVLEQIKQAWNVIHEWQLTPADLHIIDTPDQAFFKQWAQAFQKKLAAHHFIDETQLGIYLLKNPSTFSMKLPHTLFLAGFDRHKLPPVYKNLLMLIEKNHTLRFIEFGHPHAENYKLACQDNETEIQHMATWAYTLYKSDATRKILCVVPELTQYRDKIVDVFYEAFDIDQQMTGHLPFNIGGGLPLTKTPLIECVFQLFSLLNPTLSMDTLSYLLNNPFWLKNNEEKKYYPLLELNLLKKEKAYFSYETLLFLIKQETCPALFTYLSSLKNYLTPSSQPPSAWAVFFSDFLKQSAFPGSAALTSEQYQALEDWSLVLDQFSALDRVVPTLSFKAALKKLHELAKNTLFQTQTIYPTIYVMGLLEAAGTLFDKMWVMGMNDHLWPTRQGRNPFISSTFQKNLSMPHNSIEHEFEYCQAMTDQLSRSAKKIIFSYALKNNDEILSPSALIKQFVDYDLFPHPNPLPQAGEGLKQSIPLELFHQSHGPALLENQVIEGGSDILKQQAACPFRAFATYRLHAKLPDTLQPGLNAKNKGILLHACLEDIWRELKNLEVLLKLSEEELLSLIQKVIEKNSLPLEKNYPASLLLLEKKRLKNTLLGWLNFEKERDYFQVAHCEKKESVILHTIKMNIKIDRVDQLSHGRYVIIDYKSRAPAGSLNSLWLDERPDDPQLPLYAISSVSSIDGIAYANVTQGNYAFKGLTAEKNVLPNCAFTLNWEETLQNWKNNLIQLAESFSKGHASVSPKKGEQTCSTCQLRLLCRIEPVAQTQAL